MQQMFSVLAPHRGVWNSVARSAFSTPFQMVFYSRVSSLLVTPLFVVDCWQHWRNMQTSWQLQLFHNLFSHSRGQLSQGSTWPKGSLDVYARVCVCVSLAQSRCCQFPFHILSAAAALTASYFVRN